MSDFEFQIPDTYEAAVARKEEVLKLINDYNVALLLGNDLPCSEGEIEKLQEEYQILNDHLALTKEEKLNKLNDADKIVQEDGTIVEKVSVFDKIHWSVYVYGIISTIFATGILTRPVGQSTMKGFINRYFYDLLWEKYVDAYSLQKSDFMWTDFQFWFRCAFSYLWLPLLIIILSTVFYLLFRKRNDINTKIAKWLLIGHIVLFVISFAVIILQGEIKAWIDYYESLPYYYAYYYTQEIGSSSGY